MADPTYPLYPIFAFLGFILSLIPLPWHLQAWNSGTCYFMMWSALACLNQFINSVVWAGNALNPAPAWCEISIRIMMGASVGIPAASLCINRRLYYIASAQTVSLGRREKLRAILVDTVICVFLPLVYVALQYIVQGHRFNIFEDIGCFPALYNTLLTYFISNIWPIVIGLISAGYCILSLRSFARRRLEFSQFLNSNSSSLTISRYFRLMALAISEVVLTIPLAIFTIWLNATASPIGPWRSWDDTHFDYFRVEQIPALFWRSNRLLVVAMEFTRWLAPFCALVFFAFFGFADEARKNYRTLFWWIAKPLGFTPSQSNQKRGMVSIGHFSKPKPHFTTSSNNSTGLPSYSSTPSSASYPLVDIKRAESFITEEGSATDYEIDVESFKKSFADEPTPLQFSLKSPRAPYADRRHSSFM